MRELQKPPFRAEHVGSLKRPDGLQRERERLLGPHTFEGNFAAHSNPELRRMEDECILEAVRLQEDAGLKIITDGEFRRRTWWTDFMLGFDGVTERSGLSSIRFRSKEGTERAIPNVCVSGPVRWSASVVRGAFDFLKSNTRQTPKVTIPAPCDLHYFVGGRDGIDPKTYPDLDRFYDDLAKAYRDEIAALAEAGCSYLQIDDVALAFLCDPKRQEQVRSWGDDPFALVDRYIRLINDALATRPSTMTIGLHICRGNASAHWGAEGGYEPVAEKIFDQIAVDAYFLEYDSERAGGFEPLRHLPASKKAVLGLVTSKDPKLETIDDLQRRIDAAARYAPLERLCLSPQCGFASNYIGNPVTIDDQRRKLELVVSAADKIWNSH